MSTRAAAYVRVSTQEQAQHGWNLAEDRRLITEKCEARGWDLVEVFDDGGLQGDDPSRPGLLRMLGSLDSFDVIVMRSQDRLSRDLGIWTMATTAMRAAGVQVETFNGPLDLKTPQGEFFADMMAVVGKFEKRQTGQRVKQAMKARARAGLHNGGPRPFGFVWGPDGLVVHEPEAAIVRRIFAEYLAGKGQRQIARDLVADGVSAQRGGDWHQGTIGRHLANPLMRGAVRLNSEVYEGRHEAIVDPETWDKARQLREALRRSDGGARGRYPTGQFVFRKGHLRCGGCGDAMIPRTSPASPGRRLYEAYVCYGRQRYGVDFCAQRPVRRDVIDSAVWRFFERVALDVDATRTAIGEAHGIKVAEIEALRDRAERDAAKAQERLTRIKRDYMDGSLSAADWQEFRLELDGELAGARAEVERLDQQHQILVDELDEVDIETAVLGELTAIRAMIAGEAQEGAREGLDAFRAVLRRLFSSFELVSPSRPFGFGSQPGTLWAPPDERDQLRLDGYVLVPYVSDEAVNIGRGADFGAGFPAIQRAALALRGNNSNPLIT